MLSRRILRIKVLQALYAYFQSGNELNKAEKELFFSTEKSVELFHYLILFIIEVVKFADSRIELNKQKKMPTYNDLHPDTKFIDNQVVNLLRNNEATRHYLFQHRLSWVQFPEFIKKFYYRFIESELYKKYIENNQRSIEEDKEFISKVFSEQLIGFEDLYLILEEKSIYWNDDIDFIISMICKLISNIDKRTIYKDSISSFKNDEDIEFTKILFRKSILNFEDNKKLVKEYSQNWDIDRIAQMDLLILSMAITEIKDFPTIPVKVSFDEYIEIAKLYSTQNSSIFINGVLDKIIAKLKQEKKIIKKGKGLIGEI